jgi:hypothetical protein
MGHRRRVEDEGEDGGPEALELDDDSMTEGSIGTEDHDTADDSDTSNVDEVSPTSLGQTKSANGAAKPSRHQSSKQQNVLTENKTVSDTEIMLHGLAINDSPAPVQEINFDDTEDKTAASKPSAPVVVSSASAIRHLSETAENRRRQEHDDYKKRRDEDPAFVPNRGSFFMHDHRHAGPAANGFRPFGRGRGRGGRPAIGGPFSPMKYVPKATHTFEVHDANSCSQIPRPGDPTTNSQWTHDMHETVAEPYPRRIRHMPHEEGPANGTGFIPTREPNSTPINRMLSTEKHIGNIQVRVYIPNMKVPVIKSGVPVKQYTKLPDHRPPLRRDKPVRISLPNRQPRYIYPAVDRSFIFIPRALRPNQQRMRGKPRSVFGSIGGFSRRTSVFGGSYYGSMYSPSVAMSRRSSFGQDREMFSPTGSVMSRPAVPVENSRPVVRLPPAPRPDIPMPPVDAPVPGQYPQSAALEPSINNLPPPNTHPLPQKPAFQENVPADIPMHQPRPQKNISVADIDSPTLTQGPPAFQQAFHQQMPLQVASGYPRETHSRQPSYPSHPSIGTPLSQIPERAIHAAPFQPHTYGQASYYDQQAYPSQGQQPGYYYPQNYSGPNMAPPGPTAAFVPQTQPGPSGYNSQNPVDPMMGQGGATGSNMVAQEANGMVYYYDPAQLPPMNAYPPYSAPQGFQSGVMGMGGIVTPSPDGYYYPQAGPGMVYYPQ